MAEREPHRLVFVGGVHRSGTSALYRVLGTHAEISCLSNTGVPEEEGQHLQSVYPAARELGGAGRFGFRAQARMLEDSPLVTDENRRRLLAAWSPYWEMEKRFLVEKSPPNLTRSRFLQALFPSSSFIFIIRHPIPTTLSTMKWSHTSITSLIEHWVICYELLQEDLPFLERPLFMKYEDLVAKPDEHADMIAKLLNVENRFDVTGIRGNVNDKYFALWDRLRIPSSGMGRRYWNRVVARLHGSKVGTIEYAREIEDVETRFETAINRFGYSFTQASS